MMHLHVLLPAAEESWSFGNRRVESLGSWEVLHRALDSEYRQDGRAEWYC
jgi:hypothetical protein